MVGGGEAIDQTARDPGEPARRLLPIIPVVVAGVLLGVVAAQIIHVWTRPNGWQLGAECMSNLKKVALALNLYADDHGDSLPPHVAWTDRLQPYVEGPEAFRCPAAPEQNVGYAYAEYLAGKARAAVPHPEQTFAFWDSREGSATPAFRHGPSMNIAYVDGHVRYVTAETVFWHCTQLFERELESPPQPE